MSSQNLDHQAHHNVHFFKVILQSTIQQGELKIPRSFVKLHGEKLSNPVNLRLPNGAEWEVHWTKQDQDIWFNKGWENFAQHYSISNGHFLVFKYEGGSQFQVLIFSQSALEIDYPTIHISSTDDGENYEDSQISDDDSTLSPPHKLRKANTGARKGGLLNAKNWSEAECSRRKKEVHREINGSKALERAMKFKSNHPFFIRILYPSYLHNLLVLPTSFSNRYIRGFEGTASIVVSEDITKTWPVKLKFKSCSNRTSITSGWTQIAQEYNLEEGQVCVFEMTHSHHNQFSFKVTIFRDTDVPSSRQNFQDCKSPSMIREQ